ncbi:hypothetical protein EUGRSUZ_K00813 [Eucalyptus grandis]|uniref:Uncharacterized protein n=2 Tax=Eucalyptus grandis TaxID=71139 RepID=A0A058ZYX7_EUCGR|nr:hypothetical protein EUGRSUZ_K00813 [Eucalyptus grandis]
MATIRLQEEACRRHGIRYVRVLGHVGTWNWDIKEMKKGKARAQRDENELDWEIYKMDLFLLGSNIFFFLVGYYDLSQYSK